MPAPTITIQTVTCRGARAKLSKTTKSVNAISSFCHQRSAENHGQSAPFTIGRLPVASNK